MFTMAGGSRWFCTTPEDQWPLAEMEGAKEAIKQDFFGKWGDRESKDLSLAGYLSYAK
jgi:hypothetical protein